ncbi:hypothetical protein CVD28_23435 [Bacillus sp. M6-12]|uniref:hypothetical protein n=1 Tax=Bacillus sp. M6-12 TaxID=2054166 RepID=UPI000C784D3E|nr:hypothetical protein [Bacillus sp. M6-12]PLS15283.1 hypothetical protein CVD28_23435 [Bacillus sp. M6-12]
MDTNNKEPREGLYIKDSCSHAEVEEIYQLVQICNQHDHIKMELPLNFPFLFDRPSGENNNFFYYRNKTLIGFLGMFSCQGRRSGIDRIIRIELLKGAILLLPFLVCPILTTILLLDFNMTVFSRMNFI